MGDLRITKLTGVATNGDLRITKLAGTATIVPTGNLRITKLAGTATPAGADLRITGLTGVATVLVKRWVAWDGAQFTPMLVAAYDGSQFVLSR